MPKIIKPSFTVVRENREAQKNQSGVVLWFTGMSAVGKTTIANLLDQLLLQNKNHSYVLDGDMMRSGLTSDLGFDRKSREENLRRMRFVAEMFCDAGVITIVTLISPYKQDREKARLLIKDRFIEVYLKASLEVLEKRDPKGLYKLAREGKIADFTGINSPYERPEKPDIELNTEIDTAESCAGKVFSYLKTKKFIH